MLRSILISAGLLAPIAIAAAVLLNVFEPSDLVIFCVVVGLSALAGIVGPLVDEHRQRSATH